MNQNYYENQPPNYFPYYNNMNNNYPYPYCNNWNYPYYGSMIPINTPNNTTYCPDCIKEQNNKRKYEYENLNSSKKKYKHDIKHDNISNIYKKDLNFMFSQIPNF